MYLLLRVRGNGALFLVIFAVDVIGIAAFVYTIKPWSYSEESF